MNKLKESSNTINNKKTSNAFYILLANVFSIPNFSFRKLWSRVSGRIRDFYEWHFIPFDVPFWIGRLTLNLIILALFYEIYIVIFHILN